MPHLSGREMYTKLARQDPRVAEKIIFATGDTVRGDTLQFLEALGRPTCTSIHAAELRAASAMPRNSGLRGVRVLHVDSGREFRGGQNQVRLLTRELARDPSVEQRLATQRGSELARRPPPRRDRP